MGFWTAFGLVWDRNAMFLCFKSTRATGPARGFYSQGLYETTRVWDVPNIPAYSERRIAGRYRDWKTKARCAAAPKPKSRGEEAKTRAVAESTSITTTIARVLHPTHLPAEPNATTAPRSPVVTRPRMRATATTTTAVATATATTPVTGASTARRIATVARVILHRRRKIFTIL